MKKKFFIKVFILLLSFTASLSVSYATDENRYVGCRFYSKNTSGEVKGVKDLLVCCNQSIGGLKKAELFLENYKESKSFAFFKWD